jgi:hypothetical protein
VVVLWFLTVDSSETLSDIHFTWGCAAIAPEARSSLTGLICAAQRSVRLRQQHLAADRHGSGSSATCDASACFIDETTSGNLARYAASSAVRIVQ